MLTVKQKQLLNILITHLDNHDVSPSFDEMCKQMQLKSKSGIHRLLLGLEERGYIRRLPHRARAIEVLKYPDGTQKHRVYSPDNTNDAILGAEQAQAKEEGEMLSYSIPLLGKIAAGTPIEAIADQSNYINLSQEIIGENNVYALTIEGDSMIEAGIFDGDTVIIEETNTALNGEIVVALIDNEEATLKRLRRKGESVALEPANSLYETRIFGPDRIKIQGRLKSLLRHY